jgi:thermitase
MNQERYSWRAGLLVGLALVLGLAVSAPATMITVNGKQHDIAEPGEFLPGQVVVCLKGEISAQAMETLAAAVGGKVKRQLKEYNLYLLILPPVAGEKAQRAQVWEAVAALQRFPQVEGVFPNYKVSIPKPVEQAPGKAPAEVLEDPDAAAGQAAALAGVLEDRQWHLNKVRYFQAGSPPASAPTIAIIDSGVDYLHPDLAGKVLLGKDYVEDDMDPMDEHGHGTHAAGIAAASGTYMVRGISPTSPILAVRVLNEFGSGSLLDAMDAVVYARNYTGVKIINLSLGSYLKEGSTEFNTFKKVVDDTVAMGKLVCAAAGNEGNKTLFKEQYYGNNNRPVPAWYPNSFTVGAANEVDCRAYFSNYDVGSAGGISWNFNFVDIVAPGWKILSTHLDGLNQYLSGTSMAAPMVAGAAARVWAKYPAYTRTQVQSRLVNTGAAVVAHQGFPVTEKRLDLMKALGETETGFVGIVYNGFSGKPLYNATVKVSAGPLLTKTVYTDHAGMFVVTGLTGGTAYKLNISMSGFAAINYSATAVGDKLTDLYYPIVLPQIRPAGQWGITIKWHSWHPGYDYEPGKPAWYPYHWYEAPGTYFASRLTVPGYYTPISPSSSARGSLTQEPYAALTTDAWDFTNPVTNFVIKKVKSGVYKIWTRLYFSDSPFREWGNYKSVSGLNSANPTAYIYYGSTLKSTVTANTATGTGDYWYVGDISGNTFTKKNVLQSVQP